MQRSSIIVKVDTLYIDNDSYILDQHAASTLQNLSSMRFSAFLSAHHGNVYKNLTVCLTTAKSLFESHLARLTRNVCALELRGAL